MPHPSWRRNPINGRTCGIDWARDDHAVSVVDARGSEIHRSTIEHNRTGLRALLEVLARSGVTEVAIERPDGPLVDTLLAAGITVVVISPNQLKNLRSRYGSAGNKDDRGRFPTPEALTCLAGVAPSTRQSGTMRSVGFRWSCDKHLREAVTDFAADSRRANPWAADLYNRARARGHDHPHATRILARAWLYVIWHCWQDSIAYNPAHHRALQALLKDQEPAASHRATHQCPRLFAQALISTRPFQRTLR